VEIWRLLTNLLKAKQKVARQTVRRSSIDFAEAERKSSFTEAEALSLIPNLVKIHNLIATASNRFSFYVSELGVKLDVLSYKFDYTASNAFADWFVVGYCAFDKDLNYIPIAGIPERLVDTNNVFVVRNVSNNFQALQPLLAAAYEYYRILNQVLANTGSHLFASLDAGVVLTQKEAESMRELFKIKRRKAGAGSVEFVSAPVRFQAISSDLQSLKLSELSTLLNREFCDFFGIDSSLLNDPENKTYSNKSEALKALYTNTLIPAADKFCEAMTNVFVLSGQNIVFDYDIAAVENLLKDRQVIWQVLKEAYEMSIIDKQKLVDFVEELTANQ